MIVLNKRKIEDIKYPGYIVYWYWHPEADKQYVGITKSGRILSRAKGTQKYRGSNHLYYAIKKYGWDSFVKDVLQYGLTREEAEEWEKYYIAKWDLTNPEKGYNIQTGGLNHGGLSSDGRQRLVEKNTGGNSPVAKPIVAFSCDGKKLREFDCIRDAEKFYGLQTLCKDLKPGTHTRGGMIFRLKEDVGDMEQLPLEECKKPHDVSSYVGSNAHHVQPVVLFDKETGKRVAEFGCAKDATRFAGVDVTYCMRGTNKTCGDYICRRSEEVAGIDTLPDLLSHQPKPSGKPIMQYELGGDVIATFPSAVVAELKTGISRKAISNAVRGKQKTAGGYWWKYSE